MSSVSLDSLTWLKAEIECSLETARRRLDAYSEAPGEPALIDEFITQLHQAAGSFAMLELDGGRELAGQMESLARSIREGRLAEGRESFELLMRGCLELSDYLDAVLAGVSDPAALLLPVTNEIRARLGQGPLVRERAGRARPRLVPAPSSGEDMASLAAALHPGYQAALLDFYRGRDEAGAVARMAEVAAKLESAATDPAVFELLWTLGGLLEALADGGLPASRSIKRTLGQFERELKHLAGGSDAAAEGLSPAALADRMLAEIEQSASAGKRVAAVRTAFRLDSRTEAWFARPAVPGSSLLASAGDAVLEDLERVRDRIDIFVRTGSRNPGDLVPLDGMLKKVGDALSMLGLETARVHVEEQREAICRLVESGCDDATALLGVATGLVGVEGDVETWRAGRDEDPAALVERNARMAGLREALADIARLKEAFTEYASGRAASRLESMPRLVSLLASALDFLALGDAAALMRRIGRYVARLAASDGVPGRTELDRLADAVVSVEYWLETLHRGRQAPASMLENADRALRVLEARQPAVSAPASGVEAGEEPAPGTALAPAPGTDGERQAEAPVVSSPEAAPAAVAQALPPVREPGADPEIVAVFMDEAAEVNETLADAWPVWRDDPGNRDALTVIRRSLHTLKGSGRMVGARRLGEFAWVFENLLNRVIDYTLPPLPPVVDAVGEAVAAAPELLAQFAADTVPEADVTELLARARGLAQGAEPAAGIEAEPPESVIREAAREAAVEPGSDGESAPEPVAEPEIAAGASAQAGEATETANEDRDEAGGGQDGDAAGLPAESADAGTGDADIIQVFVTEAGELLDGADAAVHAWSADHGLTGPLAELLRRLHTLKGGARMAGAAPFADLVHELESLLIRVSEGRTAVSGALLHLVERVLDRLHRMLGEVANGGKPAPAPAIIVTELREFGPGGTGETGEARAEEAESMDGGEALDAAASGAIGTATESEEWQEAPHPRHEMARVRADLLEAAINNAGEVSIYRSRVEQQLVNMGVHLAELDRTVERLRNQLRELEIETEAQILSNYSQDPKSADHSFDPLELDRYTRIHELSRSLAEAVSDLTSLRRLFATELRQTNVLLGRQGRVNADLQDAFMHTRMVPFALSAPRLRRIVRQVAEENGKRVDFDIRGTGGEMDRQMMGHILPAVEHLLRNAVVHGIEAPALRARRGKPEVGRIVLALRQDGNHLLIEVNDDGGGLDLEAIRAKAIEANLVKADAVLTEEEIAELVFRPGVTTARDVTQSAGRGVGMDVVAAEARQVGGAAEIRSIPGRGTRCRMRLPVTLAITQVLLVRVGRTRYPVALASIGAVARLARAELEELFERDEPVFEYGGESYRLLSLARVLGEELPAPEERAERRPLLLVNAGGRRIALVVEDMEGSREIVVKPVGPQLARVPGLAGATIFGDGSIGLLLDLSALVRSLPQIRPEAEEAPPLPAEPAAEEPGEPLVMIVDDSITVRRVTRHLLERNGARVVAARDGVEALELLQDRLPDAILLDIEMPRMDGFELADYMRKDEQLRAIPIIVITSRSGEKHRARAGELGIAHYLGKPWQDSALLGAIRAVVPRFMPAPARDREDRPEDEAEDRTDDRVQGE